ncbi:helix-turn-helix domain-containing protein [Pseudonocardia sp. KRD291]|uniref:helix-turn-helix domain-containing protein n=1 Tax=Pseudonocardia sp. KRD291 TaxID=2792007 RepID=UPI001C49D9EB|nr:helix-turn-helix domain-containing protein [Pseudonocardia sp. KRD291]MBW0106239.1 helix-turn-helix domain-containing protein [Pseudonocardia sp. KRD291]
MGTPRYRELAPVRLPEPVRGLVECAWRAEIPTDAAPHEQRVLPDGCMDLLLVDGRIVVAGPDSAAHLARSAPGSATTGLRFRPGVLPSLLGVAADAVRDRRVDLSDVLPSPRSTVAPVTGNAAGALTALLGTATALVAASEHDRRRLPEPLPGAALRALATGMPAAELAARLGLTTRMLHRRCVTTLGYGPSVARRVLRFRIATALLHAGVSPAEAAARAGYADQPHLSREVRALAGVSPARLIGPRRP